MDTLYCGGYQVARVCREGREGEREGGREGGREGEGKIGRREDREEG